MRSILKLRQRFVVSDIFMLIGGKIELALMRVLKMAIEKVWWFPGSIGLINLIGSRSSSYVDPLSLRHIRLIRKIFLIGGVEHVKLSGTGVFLGFSKNKVYYVPLGESPAEQLKKGFDNYLALRASSLKHFVDYEFIRNESGKFCFYIADKLTHISESVLDDEAKKLIDSLKNFKSKSKLDHSFLISGEQAIKAVISPRSRLYWLQNLHQIVNEEHQLCASHGDLTQFNIMRNSGNTVIIDLDRFTFNGFSWFDETHYQLERYVKAKNIDWLRFILQIVESQYSILPSFEISDGRVDLKKVDLYFIQRMIYEYKLRCEMPETWIRSVNVFAQVRADCCTDFLEIESYTKSCL